MCNSTCLFEFLDLSIPVILLLQIIALTRLSKGKCQTLYEYYGMNPRQFLSQTVINPSTL